MAGRAGRGRRTAAVVAAAAMLILATFGVPLAAHPVPFSYLDLHLDAGGVTGTLVVHVFDAGHDLQVEPPERLLAADVLRARAGALADLLLPRLALSADGRPVRLRVTAVEPLPERQSIRLQLAADLTSIPGALTIAARLFPYDPQHETFVNIYEGGRLTQAIIDNSRASVAYFAGTRQGALAVIKKFVPAGIHHILIGPDHLLFLVGLLLLGGSLGRLAAIVTAFTAAHSLTLSLAALNIVSPPSRIVEPAIALSIVYVGADNLLVKNGRDVRAWIAFGFGFIHGFGFASVLREMDLPARALGWSLFSFNLGVEIGQLCVVLVVASVFSWVRARSRLAGRHLALAGSVVVIAAGAFWFVQRVFFPGGMS
jgi:hydrogenase/urease accessory protein HupE